MEWQSVKVAYTSTKPIAAVFAKIPCYEERTARQLVVDLALFPSTDITSNGDFVTYYSSLSNSGGIGSLPSKWAARTSKQYKQCCFDTTIGKGNKKK